MSRTELLEDAAASLRAASGAAGGEASDRLAKHAGTFEESAAEGTKLDHGRLARIEHALREVADAEGDAVTDHVDAAMDAISEYRSTVEGV